MKINEGLKMDKNLRRTKNTNKKMNEGLKVVKKIETIKLHLKKLKD